MKNVKKSLRNLKILKIFAEKVFSSAFFPKI